MITGLKLNSKRHNLTRVINSSVLSHVPSRFLVPGILISTSSIPRTYCVFGNSITGVFFRKPAVRLPQWSRLTKPTVILIHYLHGGQSLCITT